MSVYHPCTYNHNRRKQPHLWWRHGMEPFPYQLTLCEGNHRSPSISGLVEYCNYFLQGCFMHWGCPSLFHTAASHFIWYKVASVEIFLFGSKLQLQLHTFYVCTIQDTQAFWLKNDCGLSIEPCWFDKWGHRRCHQTLSAICRNMGICGGFRAVAWEKTSGCCMIASV